MRARTAIEILRLAEDVAGARDLPHWRPPPGHRGRHPNIPLDTLLHYAAKRGITDAELADELERQKVQSTTASRRSRPGRRRSPRR